MPFKPPKGVAEAAFAAGISKAGLPIAKQLVLGFLAGAYIAFGGFLAVVVGRGSPTLTQANPGLAKFVFGAVFPVGLILVIIAGSELFTGNVGCITGACLSGKARWSGLARNWTIVYLANFVGSVFVALFIAYLSGIVNVNSADAFAKTVGAEAAKIATAKTINLGWWPALLRGIGCNWLVCLAVWLALSSDDIAGKILGIWWPIMAFVALGLEHSVANMFFIPLGMFNGAQVSIWDMIWRNLIPVTIGNIIGGGLFVSGIYWWVYGRD